MRATSAKTPPRIDQPVVGFYRMKLGRRCPWVPVRFQFGPPPDPETGEPLDRSWRWQAFVCGNLADDPFDIWTRCCGQPITRAEYRYMIDLGRYAVKYDPGLPQAAPDKPIDLHAMRPLY